jgi:protein subunit release factor A
MRIVLTPKDFKFDWFSGTGAGGQHRNKHQNCLRLTHLETGITVTAQESRSRMQNKEAAYRNMVRALSDFYNKKSERELDTEVIRSYKLEDGLVVDHITSDKYSIITLDDFDLTDSMIRKLVQNEA